jgi:hypothetical protein
MKFCHGKHPERNSQYVKAIRELRSSFQEESLKIKNKHTILPHTAGLQHVCAALKIIKTTVRISLKDCKT